MDNLFQKMPPMPVFIKNYEHRTSRIRLNPSKTKYVIDSVPKEYNPNRKTKNKKINY